MTVEETIKNTPLKTKTPIFKKALIKGAISLNGNKKILVNVFSELFRFFVFFLMKSSIFDRFTLKPDMFIFSPIVVASLVKNHNNK